MSIVKQNQSVFDLSTQINGDVKSVLDFCLENDFSMTEDIQAGTPYVIAETEYKNEIVQGYFISKDQELATSEPKEEGQPGGIGVMIVESDFDVT